MSTKPLLTVEGDLARGEVVDRPNRFVVRVRFDGNRGAASDAAVTEYRARVYLGDPGELEGVVEPGHEVLCRPVANADRATGYDAIAVDVDETWVSLRAALANDLFERALRRELLPAFEGYTLDRREPPLRDHGRTDFLLSAPDGSPAYVEVKSCTYVDGDVAKFPDRPTERGRRHLRGLESLCEAGTEVHLVFVVQRPDATAVAPYRAVDPDFADLLARVRETGVGVHAIATAFDPPHYDLQNADLSVDLD